MIEQPLAPAEAPEHSPEDRLSFARQALEGFGFEYWEIEELLREHSPEHVLATEVRYRDRQNQADAGEIRSPKGYFRSLLIGKKAGTGGQAAAGIGSPGNITTLGDDRWTLIKEAHTNPETGVLNLEAAARDWLELQLSGLDQAGKLPPEYRVWATFVAWAPNTARTVDLDWQGETVKRRLKKGEYLISLPKLIEALRQLGKAAWAGALVRLDTTHGE